MTSCFGGLKFLPREYINLFFFSYFSVRIRFVVKKYCSCGHAVDSPVDGVQSLSGCFPLLYHDCRPISEFRGHGTKELLRENMTPSLKTQSTRKPVCRVYPDRWGGIKRRAILPRLHNFVLIITLAVLYCTLYRIHIQYGVLLEISMRANMRVAPMSKASPIHATLL